MCNYQAYGINIHSELQLPGLLPATDTAVDVTIRRGSVCCPGAIDGSFISTFARAGQEVCLCWEQVGAFLVRDGVEIIFDPLPSVNDDLVRLPLLGVVLAVLLHQRGGFVLHGSAIAIEGECVALVGAKGQGKSTLAAALYGRGHTLVADDIVVVNHSDGQRPHTLPGSAQLKLWPDGLAAALGDDPATAPVLAAGYAKRARAVRDRFASAPVPLARIYTLGDAAALRLRRLPPQDGFAQIVAHTYVSRFGEDALVGQAAAEHLRSCGRLLNVVPVVALDRPRSLGMLAETAALIEADVAGAIGVHDAFMGISGL